MFEQISNNFLLLKSLGEEVDEWKSLKIYIFASKFHSVTRLGRNVKCERLEKMEAFKTNNIPKGLHHLLPQRNTKNVHYATETILFQIVMSF